MDITKTLRVMKLTAFILLFGCLAVSANGVAQKITLKEKNSTLTKVFKEIERQTGYQFLYFDNDLQHDKKVSIDVNNANLPEVLQWCFRDQSLSYEIVDKTVVIKKKQSESSQVPAARGPDITIQGTVNDANTSLPIEGVTITVKGTTIATKTNSRGEFILTAPDNSNTLVITSIGYIATEVPISGSISVKLTPSATDLSEVVVVGYETMRKSDLTGAIT